jgi:hypothetical protein
LRTLNLREQENQNQPPAPDLPIDGRRAPPVHFLHIPANLIEERRCVYVGINHSWTKPAIEGSNIRPVLDAVC